MPLPGLGQLAKALSMITDWATRQEDRKALLDALQAELESNLTALNGTAECDEDQWQKAAVSRWLDPETRRVLQRAYRLLGEYNRQLRGYAQHGQHQQVHAAADAARPWVAYAASCVGAKAVGKPMPPRPSELKP